MISCRLQNGLLRLSRRLIVGVVRKKKKKMEYDEKRVDAQERTTKNYKIAAQRRNRTV